MRTIETGRRRGAEILPSSIFNCWRYACQCNHSRSPLETTNGAKTIVPSSTIKVTSEINNRRFFSIRAHCFNGKSAAGKAASQIILPVRNRRFHPGHVCEDKLKSLARVDSFVQLTLQFLFRFRRQTYFDGLTTRHFRKLSEFILEICTSDFVPKTIFEREHIHVLFLDADN